MAFVPTFLYTIMDTLYYGDDLMRAEPEGAVVQRDLFLLAIEAGIYTVFSHLLNKTESLERKLKTEPAPECIKHLEEITEDFEEETSDNEFASDALKNYELGNKANSNNDFRTAEKYFEKCAEMQPDKAEYHYALVVVQFNSGKYRPALSSVSKAIDINDKNPNYYILTEKIYNELGDSDKAKKARTLARHMFFENK